MNHQPDDPGVDELTRLERLRDDIKTSICVLWASLLFLGLFALVRGI